MKNSNRDLARRRKQSKYEQRRQIFTSNITIDQTHDLLVGLSDDGRGRNALETYMDNLDQVFDVSVLDTVPSFLTMGTDDELDQGLRFVQLDEKQLQQILGDLDKIAPAMLNGSLDNQIVFDRSDIVSRVLKSRTKDTNVTIVRGPSTSQ